MVEFHKFNESSALSFSAGLIKDQRVRDIQRFQCFLQLMLVSYIGTLLSSLGNFPSEKFPSLARH